MPLARDSPTFSASCRHALQRRNRASPSFHSLVERSKTRGVDATVKLATAAPDGVNRSSGSAVRLPTTVIVVSLAMPVSFLPKGEAAGMSPGGLPCVSADQVVLLQDPSSATYDGGQH